MYEILCGVYENTLGVYDNVNDNENWQQSCGLVLSIECKRH